ncbi:MAG: DUF4234 domain-containing protein [Oscillospiraceae bacterium]|jgi:hypothetical protein|nr:DUF4234 domain-containing protein [Oscillospiraceae bacterium]
MNNPDQTTTVTFTTNAQAAPNRPVNQLSTHRGFLKYILLTIVTLGIYHIVFFNGIASDVNTIAGRNDGKKTMNYWLLSLVIGPLTLGIGYLVWYHKLSKRVGKELRRREHVSTFGSHTFWLWNVLGTAIVVGPFIYVHKLCVAVNRLAKDYNENG